MTDFHHNIFYYYSGGHRSDQERERQLENNTTKALINTLQHCSPSVSVKFLAWLGIIATKKPEFELQKVPIGPEEIRRKSQQLLLGLVQVKGEDDPCTKLEEPVTEDSRPDAWIYGDDFVVLIESKVGDSPLRSEQMRRHYQKLRGDTEQEPKCKVRTWAEVYQFFKTLPNELTEMTDKDEWLVEQFTQYLEGSGMATFIGLEAELFDYFINRDDEDVKQRVRGTMRSFAEEVLAQLKVFNAFYQVYDIGTIRREDEHCWVAFGPKGPKENEYRQWAHQSISLNALGIEVFVNVELKAAIDRLKERIFPDDRRFREIVSGLPGPFFVQLEERKQRQGPLHDSYIIAKLEAGYRKSPDSEPYGLKNPQSDGFDYIKRFLDQVHLPKSERTLPCLSVRRRIDRETACKQGRSLVDEVVGIMREFHPLVEFT